ncbi:MAG TPA: sterol desaturase family protein [Myxococcota bacterium]|nr:sterol desaturase family protein [Myxococcota bacterium]
MLLINGVQLGVVLLAGVSWERWLSRASLLHLSSHLSPAAGGLLAYFVATFIFYWWHRWRHEDDRLWIGFHQIHHSPQRLEVITSFYKHPGEMIVNSTIGSLLVYACLGLSIQAGAVYTMCTALGEFFYHTNVKTPRWVSCGGRTGGGSGASPGAGRRDLREPQRLGPPLRLRRRERAVLAGHARLQGRSP